MTEKIALLVDSGTDISPELRNKENVFVLPLRIIFSFGEFIDKQNITSDQLFEYMEKETPSTSLPSGQDIVDTLDNIKSQGFTHVCAIAISSGLSGTYNFLNQIISDYEGLESFALDTKNISIASGMIAHLAHQMIEDNQPFDRIIEEIKKAVPQTKVFFTVGTLEYLKKGGRIGLVAGTVAELLNVKPIISCNEEGVYYTVTKIRGRKRSHDALVKEAVAYATELSGKYSISITYGDDYDALIAIKDSLLSQLTDATSYYEVQVSPALAVHTGPDAVGISIQRA